MSAGSVIVVGGGMAGLSVALAAARTGWAVTLCEQAPRFGSTGAGLTMAPSATAALRFLGVGEAFGRIAEASFPPAMLDWASGEALPQPPGDSGHLGGVRRILRSDLHAILAGAVRREPGCTVRLGMRLTDARTDGDRAVALFADGTSLASDVLLAADGIRSRVRPFVLGGEEQASFTGYVAWRFLLPFALGGPLLRGRAVAITAGADATLTCYTIGAGALVNCVAIVRAAGWAEEGWTIPGDPAELARHFATAHPDAQAIVAAAPADRLFKWALFDREPTACWVRGRVALLGDAAHPVLPFLGLGAGLAIEDAVVLARSLAAFPVGSALRHYVAARAPRAALVQRLSRAQGESFSRIGRERTVAQAPFFDRTLFDYDPVTAVLG